MFQRICCAIALSMSLLFVSADASAQIVQAVRIEILPSANPSESDRVVARISWDQVACYTFTYTVTAQPGGVFEVRTDSVSVNQPFPCTQNVDVDLGVLPQGNYSVVFSAPGPFFSPTSTAFIVGAGAVPIPAVGGGGIVVLAILLALMAFMVDAKARRKVDSKDFRAVLVLGSAVIAGALGSTSPAFAAEVAGRGIATDLIVRFDRKVEARSVSEIVDTVNGRSDLSLSSRLLGPSSARRLLRREPTAYERDIIARYPFALVSQMFEYILLTYDNVPDLQRTADSLRNVPSIKSVERVEAINQAAVDPYLGSPPLDGGTSNNSQWGLHALSLPSSWLKTKGRATIAYLDSGLVTPHEDLTSNFRSHLSRNVTVTDNGPGTTDATNMEDQFFSNGVNFPGHGTHVAGILAATNDNGLGISGGCPKCSLIAVKDSAPTTATFAVAIDHAIRAGAQVINFSREMSQTACNDPANDGRAWCTALGRALEAGISVVAAAGNSGGYVSLPAPANSARVIAAGGLQPGPAAGDTTGQATFWKGDIVYPPPGGKRFGSDYHNKPGYYFLAPAAQVLSTFPSYVTYSTYNLPHSQWGCADALGRSDSPGYGNCTGTSMAAPHIAAIAALIRSVQPTLDIATTASLLGSTPNSTVDTQTQLMQALSQPPVPATVPNANSAVQAALGGTNSNRRTPLFSFFSSARGGHFYTSSPQAGKSALVGTLIPSTSADPTTIDDKPYLPVGNTIDGYGCFPPDMVGSSPISCTLLYSPRALVEVYTTEVSPYGGALLPLYRLSRVQSGVVRYNYETNENAKNTLLGQGWLVDGIEGFVLPAYQPDSVKLCRKFNPNTGDYLLIPGSGPTGDDCSAQTECQLILSPYCGPYGYTTFTADLGYVFPSPVARYSNISTRAWVGTNNDVAIAGFIITGMAPKTVVVAGRGPSLTPYGVPNVLANPVLYLVSGSTIVANNDDWGSAPNWQQLLATGFAPSYAPESAILITLNPGAYTAILAGTGGGQGVGIVEVFEVDQPNSPLSQLSTRALVLTGDNVMIGGFVVTGSTNQAMVIRARGPSLIPFGITNALMDPFLYLFSGSQMIAWNNNWYEAPNWQQIQASGYAPSDYRESAIMVNLPPGPYTAIVVGAGGTTGVGIVEFFPP